MPSTPRPLPRRLASLDVLRGFDMFWIIGGMELVRYLLELLQRRGVVSAGAVEVYVHQTEHVGWEGFVAWDLVFPLFLFTSGVTIPFVVTSRIERGESRFAVQWRLLRRAALLVFLGSMAWIFRGDFDHVRWYTVLWLIGMGYFIAGTVALYRPLRGQIAWCIGLLLGTWMMYGLVAAPGAPRGIMTPTLSVASFLDRHLLQNNLYMHVFDPEGTVRILPAGAMALIGAIAGDRLRRSERATHKNALLLFVAGLSCLAFGYAWGFLFPIVKSLWTSSFVVFAAGWSLLLLALFYLVIDVWRQRWLGWVFLPIGMNALAIYIGRRFIDFDHTAKYFFGGLADALGDDGPLVGAAGVMLVQWLLLLLLYRKRIFIRV